ncbi:LysR family transcriptional regulator [Sinirhodobacter huangdaonensis]|uniref:LysR family transcriptional regulator n=1 Tax=Paenirhodobacter huangdaonensis TaxID=2501515 RepID=A0A443LEF5_9RHOB|nr:LysR family transcriptional regulator [Sinirhodobacter huangdaonensis]
MRLRHLRCFFETARFGSLSAAAEALHVSQPAASKTIGDPRRRDLRPWRTAPHAPPRRGASSRATPAPRSPSSNARRICCAPR